MDLLYLCAFVIYLVDSTISQEEYCHAENFSPACSPTEILNMDHAKYGQMKIGRCIDGDYGYLGCTSDQLKNMDRRCSGLQSCEVEIEDKSMDGGMNCTIPKTFTRYFEGGYSCKTTFVPEITSCNAPYNIELASVPINIASITTKATSCGIETKPWIIKAKPGQIINITLTDYFWESNFNSIVKCPVRYGYVIDVESNQLVDICGGREREKHVYSSVGSSIQITLDANLVQNKRYLLTFQVSGCPKIISQPDTWMKLDGNVATVGCVHTDVQWKMRCIGNHWIGISGKCNEATQTERNNEKIVYENYTVFGMAPVIGFTLIGGIFSVIITITITVIIGFFCIRKPQKPMLKEKLFMPFTLENDGLGTMTLLPFTTMPSDRSTKSTHRAFFQPSVGPTNDAPEYFVLENPKDNGESKFDVIYQNIADN